MLANPDWGVEELAGKLDLDSSQIRAFLIELAEKSLVFSSRDDPDRWRARSPKVALTAFIANQEAELDARVRELQRSREAVASMVAEFAGGQGAGSDLELVSGSNAVRSRLEELALDAREEVLVFAPGGPQRPEVMEASRPLDEQTLRRGVTMRTIYLDSIRNSRATMGYAAWLVELGAEVRTNTVLPLRMIIVDRAVAVVPLNPDDGTRGAHVISSAGAMAAFVALFDQIWDTSTPIGETSRDSGDTELTAQERTLLRLLGQGYTDEVAARRLGVSLRTVRRIMADVMSRTGARSRFQVGLRVGERGWFGSNASTG